MASVAIAWGFGKNKVQYEKFLWSYYQTPHFQLYYHQNQGTLPKISAQWLENDYYFLNRYFHLQDSNRIPVIVYGSPILFEQTNVTPDIIPEGVGGFTEMLKSRVVIPFTGSYQEYRHVLHHELVHAFEFATMFNQFGGSFLQNEASQMPLWFAEGLAEYLSSGWDSESDMFLMDRTIYGTVPIPGPDMYDYMVYKGGQSFLYFLQSAKGDSAFYAFITAFTKTKKVETALEQVYKRNNKELGKEWIQELKRIYWPELGKREKIEDKATQITDHKKKGSSFYLKPKISPNGQWIAYYSDESDYTKIYITDVKGKLYRTIGQYGYGGFFEAFEPFRSGMCWSPESDKLAFVTKNEGKNEIRITNIQKKSLVKKIVIPYLIGISSPSWSHKGSKLVFCGQNKDRSDLYLYLLDKDSLIQLTNNLAYETTPSFSFNDSSIIFSAIDTCGRPTVNSDSIKPSFDLFSIDINSKEVRQLTDTPFNEKEASLSPGGKYVVFVSDRNGINNLYCAPAGNLQDSAKPLTNFIGGCSNPDWCWRDEKIVFTLFKEQGWDIWLLEEPLKKLIDHPLQPTLWVQSRTDSTTRYFLKSKIPIDTGEQKNTLKEKKSNKNKSSKPSMPPVLKTGNDTTQIDTIANPKIPSDSGKLERIDTIKSKSNNSLPKSDSTQLVALNLDTLKDRTYSPKFSVDMVSVGVAYNSLYGAGGQGVVQFSDLLGNHQIVLAGNVQNSWDENNFFLSYFNSAYRLNFGFAGFFERHAFYKNSVTTQFLTIDTLLYDTNFGTIGTVQYPFSLFSRTEFTFFYQRWKRDQEIIRNGSVSIPRYNINDINITMPSLSYSFDNILWGITGPLNGFRAKATLRMAIPFASSDPGFFSFDTDMRLYTHFDPGLVWANRLTFGMARSFNGSDIQRRYFLGGNENWMFYSFNEKNYQNNIDNTPYSEFIVPFRGWNYFDIVGSRYAVLNTEFRFPFVHTIAIAWPLRFAIRYINGALFMDFGNAWDPSDQMKSIPIPKKLYSGAGFGLRMNLGIFILRYDHAWKNDANRFLHDPIEYFSLGTEF